MHGYRTKSSRSHLITPPLSNPSITETWQEDQSRRNPSASWETTTQIDWNHLHSAGQANRTEGNAKEGPRPFERSAQLSLRREYEVVTKGWTSTRNVLFMWKKCRGWGWGAGGGAAFHSNELNKTLNDKANWKCQKRIVHFLDEWHCTSDIYDLWVHAAPSIVPFQTHFNNRRPSHIAASGQPLFWHFRGGEKNAYKKKKTLKAALKVASFRLGKVAFFKSRHDLYGNCLQPLQRVNE